MTCMSTFWFAAALLVDMGIASTVGFVAASLFAVGGRT
jgi:hypothetical protein